MTGESPLCSCIKPTHPRYYYYYIVQKKNPLIRSVGQLFTNAICPKVLRQLGFLSSAAIIVIVMVVSPPFTLPLPSSYNSSIWPSTASSVDHGKPSSSVVHSVIVNMLGCCVVGHIPWNMISVVACDGSCYRKHGHPDRQTGWAVVKLIEKLSSSTQHQPAHRQFELSA